MDKNALDMNVDDLKLFEELTTLKQHIFACMDRKVLVEHIQDIVEKAKHVEFKDELSKKFINTKRISLNLYVTKKAKSKFDSSEDEVAYYSSVLHEEVIIKIIDYINSQIRTLDLSKFTESSELFKDAKEDNISGLSTIISTITGYKYNMDDKRHIVIELFM